MYIKIGVVFKASKLSRKLQTVFKIFSIFLKSKHFSEKQLLRVFV